MFILFMLLAMAGFGISIYTYLLERKIKSTPTYKPFCDISDRISCSKPMQSEYGNLLFFSNATIGILFYALVAFLAFFELKTALFAALLASCLTSCYLAYLLYYKIKSLCLLCTATYLINFLMLALYCFTLI